MFSAVLLCAALASAQSLGDYARAQRAKKAAEESDASRKKPKVYTNDDLPKSGGLSTTAETAKPAAKAGEKGAEAGKTAEATKESGPAKATPELEKEYRDRFAKLRDNLATEQKKLDVLQRELNLANIQYYSNPDQALREQTMRTEINNKTAEIEKQKAAIDAAQKAIDDLTEEVHRKGLPPGWAR